jgi:hypothetical protein
MIWLVLSYTLPTGPSSSARVTLWRRLRRLGAIAPVGGAHVLPAREECVEAFQWLAQEIRQAQGEALLMRVEAFEGLTDAQMIALFCAARAKEYAEIDTQATALEATLGERNDTAAHGPAQDELERLRRRHAEIARIDCFACDDGPRVVARLRRIAEMLTPATPATAHVTGRSIDAYRNRVWVTRPRPHVDRLACAWLIRHFIDPQAVIRYTNEPAPEDVTFDMPDAHFGHQGDRCTFETMLAAFGLDGPGLQALAAIVHEIDLRDGREVPPETIGIDAILRGWIQLDILDAAREAHGIALFDGLYATLQASVRNGTARSGS